jgi:hypothetical protein
MVAGGFLLWRGDESVVVLLEFGYGVVQGSQGLSALA